MLEYRNVVNAPSIFAGPSTNVQHRVTRWLGQQKGHSLQFDLQHKLPTITHQQMSDQGDGPVMKQNVATPVGLSCMCCKSIRRRKDSL